MALRARNYSGKTRFLLAEEAEKDASVCGLCRAFAFRTSAHGFQRVAGAHGKYRQLLWGTIVFVAISGFTYHSIFLISNYLRFPRMTTTEEVHADSLEFPAITVCNLNPLKKTFFEANDISATSTTATNEESSSESGSDSGEDAICYRTFDDFIRRSRTMDLSDMWMNLIATKDDLNKYGHQASDMIAQCTYNARNCINGTFTSLVNISRYPSPRFGLCHTIVIASEMQRWVTKTGSPFGLRLTLNIERDEYLDLVSSEYGARLVVHPPGTFPTVQRGGVVLQPGTKTYVSVRMRRIRRLPKPYRGCSEKLEGSIMADTLKDMGPEFLKQHDVYTYEYCQTLCREGRLFKQCGCLEELSQEGNRSCDPCNITQVQCRSQFYRNFSKASSGNSCQELCLPACKDIRYDLTVSQSEWPNLNHQKLVIKKWPKLNKRLREQLNISEEDIERSINGTDKKDIPIDLKFLRENFLRVHIYLQEKNYLSVTDVPAITLFADLGGCLGLYIGVSAITIVEILEQCATVLAFLYNKHVRANGDPNQDPPSNNNHVGNHVEVSQRVSGQKRRSLTLSCNQRYYQGRSDRNLLQFRDDTGSIFSRNPFLIAQKINNQEKAQRAARKAQLAIQATSKRNRMMAKYPEELSLTSDILGELPRYFGKPSVVNIYDDCRRRIKENTMEPTVFWDEEKYNTVYSDGVHPFNSEMTDLY